MENEEMIAIKDVAKILGVQPSTIHGWIFRKKVPFPMYKLNERCIRFKKQDILDYLEKAKNEKN